MAGAERWHGIKRPEIPSASPSSSLSITQVINRESSGLLLARSLLPWDSHSHPLLPQPPMLPKSVLIPQQMGLDPASYWQGASFLRQPQSPPALKSPVLPKSPQIHPEASPS